MDWRIKALIFKTASLLPGSIQLMDFYRVHFGRMASFPVTRRFDAASKMLAMVRSSGVDFKSARFLELGAGWQPTIPVLLYLAGARHILMTDIKRSLGPITVGSAVRQYIEHSERLAEMVGRPADAVRSDLAKLLPNDPDRWQSCFEHSGLTYLAPLDLAGDSLPEKSIDVIFSNSVLNFVPVAMLKRMIAQMRRMLAVNGVCCHNITIGDEFTVADPNITIANPIRFSKRQWRFWGQNRILHQNRLRPSDYVKLFEQAGFVIESCDIEADEAVLPRLKDMSIHHDFQQYPPLELAARHAKIIARAK
jgi:hypothetical protein